MSNVTLSQILLCQSLHKIESDTNLYYFGENNNSSPAELYQHFEDKKYEIPLLSKSNFEDVISICQHVSDNIGGMVVQATNRRIPYYTIAYGSL